MSSSDTRPRLFNPGWGLWVFLAFALAFPLVKFWPGGHPLASATQVDTCAVARRAAMALPAPPATFAPGAGAGSCELQFSPSASPAGEAPAPEPGQGISVLVMTQAMLSRQGAAVKTAKWIEISQAEVRASSPGTETAQGPWRTGFVSRSPSGQQLTLHAEDEGVVLMLVGRQVERAVLLDFGAALARALRKSG